MTEKYYYELSKDDETLYCTVDVPVKAEKLPEMLCLSDYKARQITKEEYEREAEQDADRLFVSL